MKTLKEVKIERFAYNDKIYIGSGILLFYQITYIWETHILFYTKIKEERLPLLFKNEEDAMDFVECGGRVKNDSFTSSLNTKVYSYKVYKEDEPDYLIHINENMLDDENKDLWIVKGFYTREAHSNFNAKLSEFLKVREEVREKVRQQELKEQQE